MTIGGSLCFIYGQKISNQLKSGKVGVEESPQLKRMKRMCRLSCLITLLGILIKLSGVGGRRFQTNQSIPTCDKVSKRRFVLWKQDES